MISNDMTISCLERCKQYGMGRDDLQSSAVANDKSTHMGIQVHWVDTIMQGLVFLIALPSRWVSKENRKNYLLAETASQSPLPFLYRRTW